MQIKLYDEQAEAIEELRIGFRLGYRVQLLYSPTGGGKTEMAIALMDAAKDKGTRSAMLLDRIVLCDQTSTRLDKYGIGHGVLQSGHWRYRPYEQIQVCSTATLEKRGSFPDLKFLIVDECHDQRESVKKFIKNNPKVMVVGLSASPFSKGLGETYETVVCAATTQQLVEAGRLAPLKVYVARQIDMKGAKKVAGEFAGADAGARGMKITGDIVSEWTAKTMEHFGRPRKTIVFCCNVAHGADIAQKFAEAGFNFVAISYKDTDEYKSDVIEEFQKPDSNVIGLIACDILTKGFDSPDVMIGVSARPFSKSFKSHVQQMGRTMRSCLGKDFALWLDFSGNYIRFRTDWEELYANGVQALEDDKEKSKPNPTEKEIEESRCPKCSRLWPRGSDTCPGCGYTRVRLNLIENVPGELVPIGGGKMVERKVMQEWYSQLLEYGDRKGWAHGAAYHRFRDKFGIHPPRSLSEARAPLGVEVANWLKYIAIRNAKGAAKSRRAEAR